MPTKVINTVLNLKDNMSKGLLATAKNIEKVNQGSTSATRSVLRFANKAGAAVTDFAKKTVKFGAAAVTGLATGFLALDNVTEEYRIAQGKLNTAYEAAGYSAQTASTAYNEFYKILGDTDTATEASQLLSKLVQSEEDVTRWTRIAAGVSGTFGDSLPVEGLIEAANETARTGTVTGVLADALNWAAQEGETFGVTMRANTKANESWNKAVQEAESAEDYFNLALQNCGSQAERNQLIMSTLAASYEGAADAFYRNNEQLVQARANQTAVNTVTAKLGSAAQMAKNSIWQLLGAQEDGSLRAGSALDWLSQRADGLMEKFQQWSQDGTVTRLAQQFDQGLAKGIDMASRAFQWVVDNGDTIKRVLVGVGTALAAVKILKFASDTITAVKTVGQFLNVATLFLSTNPIYLGIMAAITAGSLLIANWDTVKATALDLWNGAKQVFGGIRDSISGAFDSAKETVSGFFSWIGGKLSELDQAVEGIPVLGSVYKGAKSVGGWVLDKLQGNALGTSYFSGGLTRVNERGGEIINLPSGTQIIPHDISRRMAGGRTINVYVTVQGNVIGNAQYANSLGNLIAQKVLRAMDNT